MGRCHGATHAGRVRHGILERPFATAPAPVAFVVLFTGVAYGPYFLLSWNSYVYYAAIAMVLPMIALAITPANKTAVSITECRYRGVHQDCMAFNIALDFFWRNRKSLFLIYRFVSGLS